MGTAGQSAICENGGLGVSLLLQMRGDCRFAPVDATTRLRKHEVPSTAPLAAYDIGNTSCPGFWASLVTDCSRPNWHDSRSFEGLSLLLPLRQLNVSFKMITKLTAFCVNFRFLLLLLTSVVPHCPLRFVGTHLPHGGDWFRTLVCFSRSNSLWCDLLSPPGFWL